MKESLTLYVLSCSYLPWFEIYYKLLNTLADYLLKQQVKVLFGFLICINDTSPWKIRRVGLIWLKQAHSLVVLKLHRGWICIFFPLLSILFSSRMLLVAFCVQVLFAVSGSTWLLLLAATMLTFHRPNADLTLEVIPDDLLENKLLRIKKKKEKEEGKPQTHAGSRAQICTQLLALHKSLFPWLFAALHWQREGNVKYATN